MGTFKRRLSREKVLQALYAYELSKEPIGDVMKQVLGEIHHDKKCFDFATKLIHEVVSHQQEIERIIKLNVSHWESDRIAVIDRMLLRMGICELLYFPEIPPKVTINESIEIAKVYSTENSGAFVNGVLDAVLDNLKKNNDLNKSGRGLIDQTAEPNSGEHPKPSKSK